MTDTREAEVRALFDSVDLEFVHLDLNSDDGWAEALDGVDMLIHSASPIPAEEPKDPQVLIRPAVDGTLRALKAAQAASFHRVVLTSSCAAMYKDAAKPPAQVSTADNWTDPDADYATGYEASKTLAEKATEQAAILAKAGADLMMLEMMASTDRMKRLVAAAKTTGLPVWVGFSVGGEAGELADPNVMSLRSGELLTDAVRSLDGLGVDLINIMHTDVALIDQCLDDMFEHWSGPIGVYAHSWPEDGVISPADYAAASQRWLDRGACLIGGCCGTEPSHMIELAKLDGLD